MQSFAGLRLDRVWWCGKLTTRRLRSCLEGPAAHAAGMGLSSLSGLRKWLSDWFKHVAQDKCFMYQVLEQMRLDKPLERQHRPLS